MPILSSIFDMDCVLPGFIAAEFCKTCCQIDCRSGGLRECRESFFANIDNDDDDDDDDADDDAAAAAADDDDDADYDDDDDDDDDERGVFVFLESIFSVVVTVAPCTMSCNESSPPKEESAIDGDNFKISPWVDGNSATRVKSATFLSTKVSMIFGCI